MQKIARRQQEVKRKTIALCRSSTNRLTVSWLFSTARLDDNGKNGWLLRCSGVISLAISHVAYHFCHCNWRANFSSWVLATVTESKIWHRHLSYQHLPVAAGDPLSYGRKVKKKSMMAQNEKTNKQTNKQKICVWDTETRVERVLDRVSCSSISGQHLPSCTILSTEEFIFSSKQNASVFLPICKKECQLQARNLEKQ